MTSLECAHVKILMSPREKQSPIKIGDIRYIRLEGKSVSFHIVPLQNYRSLQIEMQKPENEPGLELEIGVLKNYNHVNTFTNITTKEKWVRFIIWL